MAASYAKLALFGKPSIHQLAEFLEKIGAIVRSGGRFRVVLHTEHRQPFVPARDANLLRAEHGEIALIAKLAEKRSKS